MSAINRVVLVGNLTRDPELRSTATGTSVCRLRVACSARWRSSDSGEWTDKPNYFDVSVFDWHEWETDTGERRQAVGVIADNVQFLASRVGPALEAEADLEEEPIPF
jgi:single-strand DNA-binding protein